MANRSDNIWQAPGTFLIQSPAQPYNQSPLFPEPFVLVTRYNAKQHSPLKKKNGYMSLPNICQS